MIRFWVGLNSGHGVSEICDGESLSGNGPGWKYGVNAAFRWSTIPQKQFMWHIFLQVLTIHDHESLPPAESFYNFPLPTKNSENTSQGYCPPLPTNQTSIENPVKCS